ncbi:hypothetical protein ACTFIW_010878 [Dictyostelium discoideum]
MDKQDHDKNEGCKVINNAPNLVKVLNSYGHNSSAQSSGLKREIPVSLSDEQFHYNFPTREEFINLIQQQHPQQEQPHQQQQQEQQEQQQQEQQIKKVDVDSGIIKEIESANESSLLIPEKKIVVIRFKASIYKFEFSQETFDKTINVLLGELMVSRNCKYIEVIDKNEKEKRNVIHDLIGPAVFKNMVIRKIILRFYFRKRELEICEQYWSSSIVLYKTIDEHKTNLDILIQILHNIQLGCEEIYASLEVDDDDDDHHRHHHLLALGLGSFIDKLNPYINGLRNNNNNNNNNNEEVEIFNFNDFKQLIQSFKFEYINLSKSENSYAKQLMMDYFKESKRYIFLFYFFTVNKNIYLSNQNELSITQN